MSLKFYVFGTLIAINFCGMLRGFIVIILLLFGAATRADLQSTLSVFNETFIAEHVEIIQSPSDQPLLATAVILQGQRFILLKGSVEQMDQDVLSLILCHELGHVVGAYPRRPVSFESNEETGEDGMSMYSSEGGADYYATRTCLKKLWASDPRMPERSLEAALNFLNVKPWPHVSYSSPDPSLVDRTILDSYPSRQCRLDTFLAGALNEPRPGCWFKN